jgi:iron-sulfur cluster repair protein YtfE (RIC family)
MTLLSAPPASRPFAARQQIAGPLPAPQPVEEIAGGALAHPAAGALPRDIIAHLLATHHRSLSERLTWIESLLNKSVVRRGRKSGAWAVPLQVFGEFERELECCLALERSAVFPLVARGDSQGAAGLREATRAAQKSHAHSLKLLWALVEQVARAAQQTPLPSADEALAAEIADLRDDYYQHLYEEECLLFPQLTAAHR